MNNPTPDEPETIRYDLPGARGPECEWTDAELASARLAEELNALRVFIAEATGRPICSGCLNEVEKDVCHCGIPEKEHGYSDNHSFIPYGCVCGFLDQTQVKRGLSPDYPTSLDAMHAAEETLTEEEVNTYIYELKKALDVPKQQYWKFSEIFILVHATALQRARAFRKTKESNLT